LRTNLLPGGFNAPDFAVKIICIWDSNIFPRPRKNGSF